MDKKVKKKDGRSKLAEAYNLPWPRSSLVTNHGSTDHEKHVLKSYSRRLTVLYTYIILPRAKRSRCCMWLEIVDRFLLQVTGRRSQVAGHSYRSLVISKSKSNQ